MKHYQFRTYDLAVAFYHQAIELKLPYHLKDQLQRAASSVALNLAEGSAKPTVKDRARFYRIALGSLREVQAVLALSRNDLLSEKADCLGAHLYKLCKGLEH
jgi:four helix bundle protein